MVVGGQLSRKKGWRCKYRVACCGTVSRIWPVVTCCAQICMYVCVCVCVCVYVCMYVCVCVCVCVCTQCGPKVPGLNFFTAFLPTPSTGPRLNYVVETVSHNSANWR